MSSHEYNQLLKFLYFEGYADSYAEAEELLESMSDEEFEELNEKRLAHSFPLKPSERRSVENIRAMLDGKPKPETPSRSARRSPPEEQPKARKRTTDLTKVRMGEEFESVVEYLFVEGFADTIENAEVMSENISETWVNDILNEKYVKAMDTAGRGADRRAHTTDPTVRPIRRKPTPEKYKHSEAEFDSTLTSPGARKRKEERRQGVGGFREEYEEMDEAKVDWHNRHKENVQDRIKVLRDRNKRLQSDRPEIPSGRDQTDFRTKRHKDSRGKTGSVTEENYEIDEAAKDQSDKQIDQGVKKTYKAGNVLDNTHQGRSPGLNKLPRSERDAKVERMRSRLKARRDDLFQERGNREDAKRAELKKLLGL
jgi:hypothetical protein